MQTPTPVHHLAAERHAELVDRLCEVPDGPDRRESIAKLLAELGGIYPEPPRRSGEPIKDQAQQGELTQTEQLILRLFDDIEDVSELRWQ